MYTMYQSQIVSTYSGKTHDPRQHHGDEQSAIGGARELMSDADATQVIAERIDGPDSDPVTLAEWVRDSGGDWIAQLQTTSIGDAYRDVILTAGMTSGATGRRLIGVFGSASDARSESADDLAIATLDANVLTPEQVAMAERNSAAI